MTKEGAREVNKKLLEGPPEPYLPLHLLYTRNVPLNLCFWALALYVGYTRGNPLWILAVHTFCVLCCDIFKFVIPLKLPGKVINFFNDDLRTAAYYEFVKLAARSQHGEGVDLGFNLYEGDYTRTPEQAQLAKFEFAFKEMGLKEGMRVLDIGCGFGDWLYWLKHTKKCTVMGINMTHGQADVVESRGMKCLRGTWQAFHASEEFEKTYGGQFDGVSAWDTVEHYVKGKDIYNVPVIHETYRNLFKFAHKCIDPATKCGRFWTSTLHRQRWLSRGFNLKTLKEWGNCYLMCITYAGCYPGRLPWSSLSARAPPEFKLEKEWDKIEDYRMTSLVCKNHFGNFELNWDSPRFWFAQPIFFVTSPHYFMILANQARRETAWMWHVGGIEKEPAKDTPVCLLWQCFEYLSPDMTQ